MSRNSFSTERIPKSQFCKQDHHLSFSHNQKSLQKFVRSKHLSSDVPLPFKPVIHEIPFEIYPEQSQKMQISKEQIFQRLIEDKRKRQQQLLQCKLQKLEKECQQTCTFTPYVSTNSKRIASKYQNSEMPTHERLYTEGVSKIKSLDLINLSDHQNKQNFPFQPQIDKDKYYLNQQSKHLAPIYQRIQQIMNKKRQNLKDLQQKQEKTAKQNKFQNQKSNEIVLNKKQFKENVLERLFAHMRQKKNKIQKLIDDKNNEIDKACTFKPSISTSTNDGKFSEFNFVERQELLAVELKQKITQKMNELRHSFQPQINKISNLIVEPNRENQTFESKIQRLHYDPILEKKDHIQFIQDQIYRECTFHPQINEISKALNQKPRMHQCNCHQKQEVYEFQPKINPKSVQIVEYQRKNSLQVSFQKPQMIQKTKKELQYLEMKECTFKPKIIANHKSQSQRSLSQIQGIQSFIKKTQLIKKKKIEDEQHREKVFNLQKGYKARVCTKVEQFKLSEPQKKIFKLKAQSEQQFKKQCTFKPQIITFR